MMRIHKTLALCTLSLAIFLSLSAQAQTAVRVGSKDFTEQFVLAEIYAQALEAAGVKTEKKLNLGGTLIAQKALEEKQIDFYPEYTGTMLLVVLKAQTMSDPKAVYDKVKAAYAKMGLAVLDQSNLNNGYSIVVKPETAQKYQLKTLSDLARVSKQLKLGAGAEFRDRIDGLPAMKATYNIEFGDYLQMAVGLRYQAIQSDQVQVVNGYSTDGMISSLGLTRLKDDKNLWPPYYVVPVIRQQVLDANPKIGPVLNRVSALLDESSMAKMNYQVDGEKREPKAVAHDFLKSKGLVK
ncbi:glycine betaine ABC transporter substrate-binding protein [Polaromonas vacuolata]|nr:glycine betaine ABC transporter substrate-binding protein [Polaromonas vacuolata]